MFGRKKRSTFETPAGPGANPNLLGQLDVTPWSCDGLTAEWAMLPARGRKREVSSVVLTVGEIETQLDSTDALRLVEHKVDVAESVGTRTAMFLWPEAAAPSSPASNLVGDLPVESLALLVEPLDEGLAAVVTGDDLESFRQWVFALPH